MPRYQSEAGGRIRDDRVLAKQFVHGQREFMGELDQLRVARAALSLLDGDQGGAGDAHLLRQVLLILVQTLARLGDAVTQPF